MNYQQEACIFRTMIVIYVLLIIFIVSPFLPAVDNPHWFFRTADFIRLQSIGVQIILGILLIIIQESFTPFHNILLITLIVSTLYQLVKVFPFSQYYPKKLPDCQINGRVSILAANVLQTNTEYKSFLEEVARFDPDLVLIMESNLAWEKGVASLEKTYPHTVKIPKENFYGMHLYSKHALKNVEVNYQVEEDIPSIFFRYQLGDQEIFFACLHPAPPSPTENDTAIERDAELMLTGKHIRSIEKPAVVCGDMNDVVWSRTSRLFRKMTDSVDPRIGRGFFPTYHAGYRFMRFPLDHLYHTKNLFVGRMERSRYYGSDHFAMYYEICLKKVYGPSYNPKLDSEEKQEVEAIIDKVETD